MYPLHTYRGKIFDVIRKSLPAAKNKRLLCQKHFNNIHTYAYKHVLLLYYMYVCAQNNKKKIKNMTFDIVYVRIYAFV